MTKTLPTYPSSLAPATNPSWADWLLTNGLGGYAMSTPLGLNTRRYHGLLVASLHPPVSRVVALSAVADTLTLDPGGPHHREINLTPFHFATSPDRAEALPVEARFTKSTEAEWVFTIPTPAGLCTVTRTLHLFDRRNAVAISYRVECPGPARLVLRPLTALRDFHALLRGDEIVTRFQARPVENGVLCVTREAGVHLASHDAEYQHDPDIWHDVYYAWEERRGMDPREDLFSPGRFVAEHTDARPGEIAVTLHASIDAMPPGPVEWDRTARTNRVAGLIERALDAAPNAPEADRVALARLTAAADDFVVQRGPSHDQMASVIAGYPWFADWGRDTMISLPGLLLATGRHEEAFKTLSVFAAHRRHGLIPNRFDDFAGPAHYNTVDAALWFLHAAAEYRRITGDHDGYMQRLEPACAEIIDAYRVGTDFGIRMDEDGLIAAGDQSTQLTWMDANRDGVSFTPRHGKAVEINALWYHGLLATAAAIEGDFRRRANEKRSLAEQAGASFRKKFVRPDGLGLIDHLEPVEGGGWKPIQQIRPNQIFAVSLPHSPLGPDQRAAVVRTVRDRLLTPMGLRTLDPGDPAYVGRLEGDMFNRDKAYHNGTVWPWLIGPYAEAVLRVGGFSADAKAEARAAITPLLRALEGHGLGQIPEIYDGDHSREAPQRPDGCPAQAWSVAEPLRILMMLDGGYGA